MEQILIFQLEDRIFEKIVYSGRSYIFCKIIVYLQIYDRLLSATIVYLTCDLLFRMTEIWRQDENSFGSSLTLSDPVLESYYRYPELFLVDINFCVPNK